MTIFYSWVFIDAHVHLTGEYILKQPVSFGTTTALVGTDANSMPLSPSLGSFHGKLELLVDAGMENVDVLRAVTGQTAGRLGMGDRVFVQAWMRADVVLLREDLLKDIGRRGGV